jgi:hypothetical protein
MEKTNIKNHGVDHNGKHYVIKVFQVGNKYIVEPYLNDKAASHYSYSVEADNIDNWKFNYGDMPPYVRLVEIVEHDIKEGNGLKKNT